MRHRTAELNQAPCPAMLVPRTQAHPVGLRAPSWKSACPKPARGLCGPSAGPLVVAYDRQTRSSPSARRPSSGYSLIDACGGVVSPTEASQHTVIDVAFRPDDAGISTNTTTVLALADSVNGSHTLQLVGPGTSVTALPLDLPPLRLVSEPQCAHYYGVLLSSADGDFRAFSWTSPDIYRFGPFDLQARVESWRSPSTDGGAPR